MPAKATESTRLQRGCTALGPDVTLRDICEDDLPIMYEFQADPGASQMAAFASKERDAFIEHWRKILADPAIIKRVIVYEGAVAGNLVFFERDGLQLVGYWLGRAFWGRGIATRALAEFLPLIATRPVFANVAQHNVGSIRVLEKNGFVRCGEGMIPAKATGGAPVREFLMRLDAAGSNG